jgi:DNA polymerase-3 subunit chi
MTRIDFHSNVANKIHYATRLVRKARAQAEPPSLVLLLENQQQLTELDNLLWTFSDTGFIAHVPASHALAGQTPVLLTDNDQVKLPHQQILVNLTRQTPHQFARFERLIEIVGQPEAEVKAGRTRYAFYKQNGHALNHFVAEAAA